MLLETLKKRLTVMNKELDKAKQEEQQQQKEMDLILDLGSNNYLFLKEGHGHFRHGYLNFVPNKC